eukprot:5520672-Pleurochrysis_carterae.AAC.1
MAAARAKVARLGSAAMQHTYLREQIEMRVLSLDLAEHAISWSTGGRKRSNGEPLDAKVLKAEAQLRTDGALPAEAAAPRMKNKTFKQLGTPTIDAEKLAEIEEINIDKFHDWATTARGTEALRSNAVQNRQPSEPPPVDSRVVGRNLELRWPHIITTPSQSTPDEHTYMWCEGEVASVADGTSGKKSERARALLPAGAVHFKWQQMQSAISLKALRGRSFTLLRGIRTCMMHGDGRHVSLNVWMGVAPLWSDIALLRTATSVVGLRVYTTARGTYCRIPWRCLRRLTAKLSPPGDAGSRSRHLSLAKRDIYRSAHFPRRWLRSRGRPLNSSEFEFTCKEHYGVTLDVITRGKAAGGQSGKLSVAETAWLWGAHLPGVFAERMGHLPDVTADAPALPAHAQPHHLADDATLAANGPRIHAPPRERTGTERRGQLTCTNLIGPFKPS